ncbi:MAG TPA: DUF4010 domain-containing protein [Stellaceae bacterium]|nr:DUF4010 domain-containing protein [Stellaceae bacterium]
MPPIELAERLFLLLALAFFFGLAFEEIYKRDGPLVPGGVRTFPLLSLAGALLYLVEPHYALAFVAGLLALAGWLYRMLRGGAPPAGESALSLIVPVANLLVFSLGPVALIEPPWVAVGSTVAAVLLIGTRERIHGLARIVPQDELLTAGKFLILVGIVLPLLPDTPIIAAAPVTPYRVWLAVVAISSLSYASYLVGRYRPSREGALLPALLGGVYSSTATTVVLAKRQSEAGGERPAIAAGILAATAIMYPRLAVVVAFFNPRVAAALLPAVLCLFAAGAALAWWEWHKAGRDSVEALSVPVANPLQLTTALVFAALFLGISLLTAWVQSIFGQAGIFSLAALVGLSDIDPFVLTLAQGGAAGMAGPAIAAAILVAASANNLAKAGYALGFGGLKATRRAALMLTLLAVLGLVAAALYLV